MAADPRFLPGLLVTSHSLLRQLAPGWSADLTLLTNEFGEEDERVLRRVVEAAGPTHTLDVRWLSLDDFRDCPPMDNGSRLAYARLLIPQLLTVERVLYIDADIVVQRDVSQLTALPRRENAVLHAVQDGRVTTCSMPWDQIPCGELGIPPSAPYFNSGFLWIDLEAWHRQGVTPSCWEHIRRFAHRLNFHDQSVMNAVLWNRWTPLDRGWNNLFEQTLGRFAVYPLGRMPGKNIHYVNAKPWVVRNPFDRPFWEQMDEIAPLVPPAQSARPPWTRAGMRKWASFLAMRAYYHYGGFLKHGTRRLLGRGG